MGEREARALIERGERDHRKIAAITANLPETATWEEIAAHTAQASSAPQMDRQPAIIPIKPVTMAPRKREPENIDLDALHRAALARSEEENAIQKYGAHEAGPSAEDEVRGMGGSSVRLSDWTGEKPDLASTMESYGSPDYSDKSVYGGAEDRELIEAGLKERKEAPQTWVPLYAKDAKSFR